MITQETAAAQVVEAYDTLLGPRLFTPWAEVLLERLSLRRGEHLLDVATGPGTVAVAAARRLGETGAVLGTDLSCDMLVAARRKPRPSGAAAIGYLLSDAGSLPVERKSFAAAACQQGLQFFRDRAAALVEMARAVRPGGRLCVSVWDRLGTSAFFAALHTAMLDLKLDAVAERLEAPFRLADRDQLEKLASAPGLHVLSLETVERPFVFEGGTDEALSAVAGTPLGLPLLTMPARLRELARTAIAHRLDGLVSNGVVGGSMRCHILLAQVREA